MSRHASFIMVFFAIAASAIADIDGTINDERGAVVSGVTLNAYRGGYAVTTAKSDAHGKFRLLTFPPVVVLLEQTDYEPLVAVVTAAEPLKFTLLDHAGRRWLIPSCTTEQTNHSGWGPLRFDFPKDGSAHRSTDIDYERVAIVRGTPPEALQVWSGLSVSHGFPTSPAWLREKAKMSARSVVFQGKVGLDFRAETNDGRVSRWIGTATNFATYESVSSENAKWFDSIIATACFK